MVTAGDVGRKLDVAAIAEDIDAAEVNLNTDEYATPAVYLREQDGSPLVTMYESGSFHVSGAKSSKETEGAVDWLVDALQTLSIEDVDVNYEVKNVVVVGDLERNIDLNQLAVLLGFENIEYEPDQFSGLVFRPPDLPHVFLIFSSGRVVIPGSPNEEVAFEAFDKLRRRLK